MLVSGTLPEVEEPTKDLIGQLTEFRQSHPGFLIVLGGSHLLRNQEVFASLGADYFGKDLTDISERLIPIIEERLRRGANSTSN